MNTKQLRAYADSALARMAATTRDRRAVLARAVQQGGYTGEQIAKFAADAASAEAEERAYRAAVADLLGVIATTEPS